MKILDISPTLSSSLAVFPGDIPLQREVSLDFQKGDHLLLSAVKATLHLGAHADAPNHYHPQGEGIDQRSLHYYLGPCQVVHLHARNASLRLGREDWGKRKVLAPRVLLATLSYPDPNHWNEDFMALAPELVDFLADQGVILLGIDTPSVDPATSQDLVTHQRIYARQMAILEGLVLQEIPEGLYTLVALPLKIKDADAAPVRAVLLEKEEKGELG